MAPPCRRSVYRPQRFRSANTSSPAAHRIAFSQRLSHHQKLTIGIDARAAAEVPAGRGRVVRELLRALAGDDDRGHDYLLYARRPWEEQPLDARFSWRLIGSRDPLWHVRAARSANRECDVFLSTNSYLTTLFLRIPTVTIVYDLTTFEPSMRPNRRSTAIERLTLGPAVRRSATLLAISKATGEALVRHFPAANGRVVVAPLGVTPALSTELDPVEAGVLPPEGFVLAVGTLEPRKNLPRLVDAYRSLGEALQREHPLVVVGALGWDTGETLQALRALGDRCTMLGHVSDAALAELYRRCSVFCYPSLGEGFGLPVLEAMAAGAPVLTSNVSSLPEVGGEAVAYADPRDVRDIAHQLHSLLEDPAHRKQLSEQGRSRAEQFSWPRFAETASKALEAARSPGR
jgi:glycosyltransferase involved in cell wall biosynthesis